MMKEKESHLLRGGLALGFRPSVTLPPPVAGSPDRIGVIVSPALQLPLARDLHILADHPFIVIAGLAGNRRRAKNLMDQIPHHPREETPKGVTMLMAVVLPPVRLGRQGHGAEHQETDKEAKYNAAHPSLGLHPSSSRRSERCRAAWSVRPAHPAPDGRAAPAAPAKPIPRSPRVPALS